jgi:hypothetical protein
MTNHIFEYLYAIKEEEDSEMEIDSNFGQGTLPEEDPDLEGDGDFSEEEPFDNMGAGGEEVSGEIELDLTGLFSKQEEIAQRLDSIIKGINSANKEIVDKIGEITRDVQSVKNDLKKDFRERTPKPEEEIMMRSMAAAPYNIKLTDYFLPAYPQGHDIKEKEEEKNEPDTFKLSEDDVTDYNFWEISKSF